MYGVKPNKAVPGALVSVYSGMQNEACAFGFFPSDESSQVYLQEYQSNVRHNVPAATPVTNPVVVNISRVKTNTLLTESRNENGEKGKYQNLVLHLFLKHGMAKEFKRRFRDALFVIDKNDKKEVEDKYIKKEDGITWDNLLCTN
jgi:hypothetical protein